MSRSGALPSDLSQDRLYVLSQPINLLRVRAEAEHAHSPQVPAAGHGDDPEVRCELLRPGSRPRRKNSVSWRPPKAEAATVALRMDLNRTRGGRS